MNAKQILLVLPLLISSAHADLVAHWQLEEGTGTTTADVTPNGLTGTIAGGATWSTANLPPVPAGTTAALGFDGIDDQIEIVGYKGISGAADRSVTAWIRTNQISTTQNMGIVSWGSNVSSNKWTFRVQNTNGTPGALRIEVNGGYVVGNTVVTDGEWHHVAVTWANDGTPDVQDAKLYVDGVLDAEFTNITAPPSASLSQAINTASDSDVRIGNNFQLSHFWNGGIDDVRIYDEAISAATVAELASGTQIIGEFAADVEIAASGSDVVLTWTSDPTNDSLVLDNGIGDVLGTNMLTVNPTTTTTYTLTGTRGATTIERAVTVLVDAAPVIDQFAVIGSDSIVVGASVRVFWSAFGDASLDLNGTDVSALNQSVLSPEETTIYTLSATNAFGTTTATVTITVLQETDPDLGWSAAGLPDGVLATWTPATNLTGNTGIVFNNATGGTVQSGSSNFSSITQWVNSPGYNLSANPNDSWHDGLTDAATKLNVSWEMVVRPGDFDDFHVLFNTGGNGAGTAITLTGSTLDFRLQRANNADQRVILSADLAGIGAATDFFHVVALADVSSTTTGTASLYINGALVSGPTVSAGAIDDWDGGDLAELGKGGNIPNASPSNAVAFTGDIATFNYYQNRLLTQSLITNAYEALGAGGVDLRITTFAFKPDEQKLEFTWISQPNGLYSIWGTNDLKTWLELADSIDSQGTETSQDIDISLLSDLTAPRRYYEVRPQAN